ncbi:hypothetical protein F5Y14DRAFT_462239 [Nemania sp. NC0429]|nr:hypothetical protein F5Y14DRAFT_462239 [Nemania sp. NC0429]
MEGLANSLTTYRRYKEDTESIAGWLAQTAAGCGYRAVDELPPTTGQLKGKARKQAREAAKDGPHYIIGVSDFTLMAGAIAKFKPAVTVPTALDNLFGRAIEARRLFSNYYKLHAKDQHQSNERHSYFTNILSSAWEILRPLERQRKTRTSTTGGHRPQPGQKDQPGQHDGPSVCLANRFSALHVETSSEQDTATEGTPQPDESNFVLDDVKPVAITKSEQDILDDFLLAIQAFMIDFRDLRLLLRSRYWQPYSESKSGHVIIPALVTNTAIQLVARAEKELDLLIEKPKEYSVPSHNFPAVLMFVAHKSYGNISFKEFAKPSLTCFFPDCEHADLLFWYVREALHKSLRYMELLDGCSVTQQTDEPDAPEIYRRVQSLIPCFRTIASLFVPYASDEVTLAIHHVFKTKTTPILTLFAIQVLLDVQDIVHPNEGQLVGNVQWHTQKVINAFESLNLKTEDYNAHPKRMQRITTMIGDYKQDVLEGNLSEAGMARFRAKLSYKKKSHKPSIVDIPPFMRQPDFYLRNNPIKCGMLQYGIYFETHSFGYKLEHDWRGIFHMIHLYTACRLLYPNDPVWPGMEYFLHYQDVDALFMGSLPKSAEEAVRKFLLALGVAPSNLARAIQRANVDGKGKLGVQTSSVWHLGNKGIKWTEGRPVDNPCVLDNIFQKWMAGDTHAGDNLVLELVNMLLDPKVLAEKARQSEVNAEELKRFTQPPKDPNKRGTVMLNLLARLSLVIESEMGSLLFDWLSFIKTCKTLWDRIFEATNGLYEEADSMHTSLVRMLDEARDLEGKAKGLDPPDVASFVRDNALGLPKSWAVIQEAIKVVVFEHPIYTNNGALSGKKLFNGDKEIQRILLVSTPFCINPYPSCDRLKSQMYKGWAAKDTNESAILHMQSVRELNWRRLQEQRARAAQAQAQAQVPTEAPNGEQA